MALSRPVYVYTGTEWVPIGPQTSYITSRWTKTMTGGETSLSGTDNNAVSLSYDIGYEQVYLNGVLLVRGVDYVATTGTTITGLTALAASDVVEVMTFRATEIADTYTQAHISGTYAPLASPVLTGTPTAPTAATGTDTTQIATTAFVNDQAPLFTNRNMLYNGAMQVAQRGTSTASITAQGYYTADRWNMRITSLGTWTQSVENDAPTGSGLRRSMKMLCTTADAAPAAGDFLQIEQILEGQDLQRICKGTSSAQQLTLSFWVKSNVTGTYVVRPFDSDNTRSVSATYTVSASGVWERKTITFPADTTGAFDNDNAESLRVTFFLGAGSDFTSGTLATTWGSLVSANSAVGQTNLASATNNYWQITGVQLEVGPVATGFEFKSFGQELRECRRYYYRQTPGSAYGAYGPVVFGSTSAADFILLHQGLRAAPTSVDFANLAVNRPAVSTTALTTVSISYAGLDASFLSLGGFTSGAAQGNSGILVNNNNTAGYLGISAEL